MFTTENFKVYIYQLYDRNGYVRQHALEKLVDCFEPVLFPHLLLKLSDYVAINRTLAGEHLLRWTKRPECSDLCVEYFLELQAIQKRIRVVEEVEEALFHKLDENLGTIRKIIQFKQGSLGRQLFQYIRNHEKFSRQEILDIAQYANDQYIRNYWTANLLQQDIEVIKQQLPNIRHVDVWKVILSFFVEQNILDRDILLQVYNRPSWFLIDFAVFALRQLEYDFYGDLKFLDYSRFTQQEIKVQLMQLIILRANKQDFIQLIRLLKDNNIIFSLIHRAVKIKYLSDDELIHLLNTQQVQYPYHMIRKMILLIVPNLDYIEMLHAMSSETVTFDQRLDIYSHLSFWDRADWLTRVWIYSFSLQDEENLKQLLQMILSEMKYQYYAPAWMSERKNNFYIKFRALTYRMGLADQFVLQLDRMPNILKL